MLFSCFGVSRPLYDGRRGFSCCRVATVSVAYVLVLALASQHLVMMLASLAVSDYSLSSLKACVSELLGVQFSVEGIWVWRAVAQGQLWGADGNQEDPFLGCSLVPVS